MALFCFSVPDAVKIGRDDFREAQRYALSQIDPSRQSLL